MSSISLNLSRLVRYGLRPYYVRRPDLWGLVMPSMDRRIAVAREWRFVYVRIPKAANSTIINTLVHHFPPESGTDPAASHAPDQRPTRKRPNPKKMYRRPHELSRREVREMFEQYFVFTVVRNPFERTLSAYLDKFHPNNDYSRRYRARVARLDGGEVTFRGFCRYLKAGGSRENCHWMPQSRLVEMVGLERVDFIGKVERLEEDLRVVVDRIHGDTAASLTLKHSGPASTHANEKLGAYYDDECRQIVQDVFRDDFHYFDYDREMVGPSAHGQSRCGG